MDNKAKKKASLGEATGESNAPVKVFRQDDVSASVFGRDRQVQGETRTFYSVTFSRSYKDSAGQWRYTKWFDLEDLGKIVALAQQASEFIHGLLNTSNKPAQA
jgi:hypothetical protein